MRIKINIKNKSGSNLVLPGATMRRSDKWGKRMRARA